MVLKVTIPIHHEPEWFCEKNYFNSFIIHHLWVTLLLALLFLGFVLVGFPLGSSWIVIFHTNGF